MSVLLSNSVMIFYKSLYKLCVYEQSKLLKQQNSSTLDMQM
jgi:hypothetical protein